MKGAPFSLQKEGGSLFDARHRMREPTPMETAKELFH